MKLNQLFKLLIDIAYYFLIPVVIFFPGIILYLLVFPDQSVIHVQIPFAENGVGWKALSVLIIVYLEFILFFIGFFNLRKLATLLIKNKLFTTDTVEKTKRIGQFFSLCGASSLVLLFGYSLVVHSNRVGITFGISEFQLLLFLVIIGVLFLLLSDAFKQALAYKDENELTV